MSRRIAPTTMLVGLKGPANEWLTGTTVPASTLGRIGQPYLRTTTGDIYIKTDAGWGTPVANNTGPEGPIGDTGPQGLPGPGAAAWTAAQAVTTGSVRQAPDGSWIKSTADRTTGATFDVTEQEFWTPVATTPGTLENTAILATIDAREGVSVTGQGGDPTGVAVSVVAIEAALGALIAPYDAQTDASANYATRGGGVIVLDPGKVYSISSQITLAARTKIIGNGATIVATAVGAGFTTGGATGFWNPNKIVIQDLTLDGGSVATTMLALDHCAYGEFTNVSVIRCAGDGATATGACFNEFRNCLFSSNGNRGLFAQPYDPTGTGAPDFNNNTFVRCHFSTNTVGGMELKGGENNTFVGCTWQFNGSYGSKFSSADTTGFSYGFGNLCVGGHWEGQPTHVYVENTLGTGSGPTGTTFYTPYFVPTPTVVERFIVNEGTETRVYGAATLNNSDLAVKDGVRAPYEQHSTLGSIRLYGYTKIDDPTPGLSGMFCDDTGTLTDPETSATSRIRTVRDATQQETRYFAKQRLHGAAASTTMLSAEVVGDAAHRFIVRADGYMSWGDGTNPLDTFVQRVAAGSLSWQAHHRPSAAATYDLGSAALPWKALYTRTVVRPAQAIAHSASGARALTVTSGPAVVTLTANITSMTFSNPGVDRYEFSVTLIQDATGGRTYVWPANAKFAGGAAPSDTTPSARTTVSFVYDNTASTWYETSRAVAVA